MFSGLSTRHRALVKSTLGTAWLLSAGAGLSAVVDPRVTVAGLGSVGTALAGGALAFATLTATAGVVFNRYQWEWVASWIATAALTPYLLTLWAVVATTSGANLGQAFLVSSLVAFYASRIALCSAHAAKLREAHTSATAVIDSVTEGDGDGDSRPNDG